MVRPWSYQIIYYFDTPALGRRHQSFDRANHVETTSTWVDLKPMLVKGQVDRFQG